MVGRVFVGAFVVGRGEVGGGDGEVRLKMFSRRICFLVNIC